MKHRLWRIASKSPPITTYVCTHLMFQFCFKCDLSFLWHCPIKPRSVFTLLDCGNERMKAKGVMDAPFATIGSFLGALIRLFLNIATDPQTSYLSFDWIISVRITSKDGHLVGVLRLVTVLYTIRGGSLDRSLNKYCEVHDTIRYYYTIPGRRTPIPVWPIH